MSLPLLRRVLSGDADAIDAFGTGQNCVVIDWRSKLPEMAEEIAAKLPGDYFRIISASDTELVVEVGSRSRETVAALPGMKQEEVLLLLDRILRPEYEMRQFRPVDGDGYSIYLSDSSTWSSLEQSNPDAVKEYFLPMDRLAAYWKKSFIARLISKP